MEPTPRLYSCALCRNQVVICSTCDRGNIYCSGKCSNYSRKKSQRESSSRYQQTPLGKLKHAARQLLYRLRQKEKVTHQGSLRSQGNALLKPVKNKVAKTNYEQGDRLKHCCICQKEVNSFFRVNFSSHRWQKKPSLSSSYEKPT